ncbi:MAG: hypothetical protein OET42_07275, partial [Deltaproteobacteria bacterium]|nr:hypothetical protein [Deltaproteobacteria bacterium]
MKKNSDEPSLLSSDYRTGEVAFLLTLSVSLRTLIYGVLPLSAEVTTIKKSISWEDVVNNSLARIIHEFSSFVNKRLQESIFAFLQASTWCFAP